MKFLEDWKMAHLFRRTNRLMRACVRYCKYAEKYAMEIPGCKKFRGVSMTDDTMRYTVDIKVNGEEKE